MPAERFRAMGTDVHLLVHGPPTLLHVGRRRIDGLERRWSRFIESSEISRLNAAGGAPCLVSRDTVTLISRAIDGWRMTDGRFDPTVLGDVIRNGYDRSFDDLALIGDDATRPSSDLHRGCDRIEVDAVTSIVRLPNGVGFDPGGIGKGLAADLVADELMAAGAHGVLVNIGGDLRVVGDPPDDDAWVVAIEHPDTGLPVAVLAIGEGAVATSSPVKRQWTVAGSPHHHLVVPATGRPASSDVASASTVASLGWQAEVLAKAAYLGGVTAGLAMLERSGVEGLLIDVDGGRHTTPGLVRFEHPAVAGPAW
jgi:thiamine biosynthesis lipoprotein